MKIYSHDELVKKAIKWLWGQGCAVVVTEMAGGSQEPDAIGFCTTYSILVECKASRSDFLSDKHKPYHRAGNSMGNKRYYFCSPGIVHPTELPDKWGLVEPREKTMRIIESAEWFMDKSVGSEISLLISCMRRIKGMMPRGVSVKSYYYQTNNRATLGIEKLEESEREGK